MTAHGVSVGRGLARDGPPTVQVVVLLLRGSQHREPDARGAPDLAGTVTDQGERRAQ